MPCTNPNVFIIFLSTPSARRATPLRFRESYLLSISIHALREEGDPLGPVFRLLRLLFLSTPSARRATFPSIPIRALFLVFLSTPSARRATLSSR